MLRRTSNGFEEYKNHIISSKYTPEWAEKITGIKASDIYEIARDFMKYAQHLYIIQVEEAHLQEMISN